MFAFGGIAFLISFIYVRPQEFIPLLARVPLLYVFFALAAFGLAIDLRLRVTKWRPPPAAVWVISFMVWAILTVVIYAPDSLINIALDLIIPLAVFALISLGVQSLHAMRWLVLLLVVLSTALAAVGVHQGRADLGCVEVDTENAHDLTEGEPDGRGCVETEDCYGFEGNPSADYLCEHVGLFGTTSIGRRVRYRGILQDPNELALAVSVGWALSFGLLGGARRRRYRWLVAASGLVTGVCVLYTQSRGGILVLVTVLGVYTLWRYGKKGALIAAILALPLIVIANSGPDRRDADASSEERLEAWATGVDLFRSNPATGVGMSQFTKYHYLTAHNSYLLAAAELGLPGLFLWLAALYLALKTTFVVSRRYRGDPAAQAAVRISDALFGALCGFAVGAFFLSLTYHMLTWILFGLTGSLHGAVRAHDPDFRIRLELKDAGIVFGIAILLLVFVRLFLKAKGI